MASYVKLEESFRAGSTNQDHWGLPNLTVVLANSFGFSFLDMEVHFAGSLKLTGRDVPENFFDGSSFVVVAFRLINHGTNDLPMCQFWGCWEKFGFCCAFRLINHRSLLQMVKFAGQHYASDRQ